MFNTKFIALFVLITTLVVGSFGGVYWLVKKDQSVPTQSLETYLQEGAPADSSDTYVVEDKVSANGASKKTSFITGSIKICKIIVNSNNHIISGNEALPRTKFEVPGLLPSNLSSQVAGLLETTKFELPLKPNSDLLLNDGVNDSYCVTQQGLKLGGYFYGKEKGLDAGWGAPLYNDEFKSGINSITGFANYDGRLFDKDPDNDNQRDTVADGYIALTKEKPNALLVVVNQYLGERTQKLVPDKSMCYMPCQSDIQCGDNLQCKEVAGSKWCVRVECPNDESCGCMNSSTTTSTGSGVNTSTSTSTGSKDMSKIIDSTNQEYKK